MHCILSSKFLVFVSEQMPLKSDPSYQLKFLRAKHKAITRRIRQLKNKLEKIEKAILEAEGQ